MAWALLWPGLYWVDGRLAEGLQSSHRAPMAVCGRWAGQDGGERTQQETLAPGWRELAGTLGWPVDGSVADGRRQAGSGIACSRARARLNCSSQGQRRGRCRVNRRAGRVSRPARAKNRRRRVLVVTICSPRPSRAVQRARLCAIIWAASQAASGSLWKGV